MMSFAPEPLVHASGYHGHQQQQQARPTMATASNSKLGVVTYRSQSSPSEVYTCVINADQSLRRLDTNRLHFLVSKFVTEVETEIYWRKQRERSSKNVAQTPSKQQRLSNDEPALSLTPVKVEPPSESSNIASPIAIVSEETENFACSNTTIERPGTKTKRSLSSFFGFHL